MESEDLKPCPFCGDIPVYYQYDWIHAVDCDNNECRVQPIILERTKTEALEWWNKRPCDETGFGSVSLRGLQ